MPNDILPKLTNEQIKKLFSVNSDIILSAAKSNNTVVKLIREVISESDRQSLGGAEFSRNQWLQSRWGERVEEVFLEQKKLLDKISFWYWLAPSKPIAMEYYYQICNKEITFADLKKSFPEASYHANKKLKVLNENLRLIAQRSRLNIPSKPINNGKNSFLLFLLTDYKPAQLDEDLKMKLLLELEQQWCDREIARIIEEADNIPIEATANMPQNTP